MLIELGNYYIELESVLFLLQCQIIFTSILVVMVVHPIHSILALVLIFLETGFYLMLLSVDYIGNLLLIVYVGAVAMLFFFFFLILNIRLLPINISMLTYLPLSFFLATGLALQQFLVLKKINFFNIVYQEMTFISNPAIFSFYDLEYYNFRLIQREQIFLNFLLQRHPNAPELLQRALDAWNYIHNIPPIPLKDIWLQEMVFENMGFKYPEYINLIDVFYSLKSIQVLGHCLYTYSYISLILAAIVLLVAMLGSISLTLYHQKGIYRQNISKQMLRRSFAYLMN